MTEHPYEVIIVGSGATGGMAALTLAQAGVKALVVEAGPQLSVKQAFGSEPSNTFNRIKGILCGEKRIQSEHPGFWKANPLLYANEKQNPYSNPVDKPFIWTRGMQVGGRSLTWGGITLRLSKSDFKASQSDGYGPDWPITYEELAPSYSATEKTLRVHGHKDGLEQVPDGDFISPLPFTKAEKRFKTSINNSLGYPFIHSRGFGPNKVSKSREWPRSSSPGSTLKMAIATGNVALLSNHLVERIVVNKRIKRATSIITIDQSTGKRKELKSTLIILCASTINSLRILLNSEASFQENGFTDTSGELGKNLMDHISICRFFSLPREEQTSDKGNTTQENILSGAGSFFIPFGQNFINSSQRNFHRGYGIWGGIDRFGFPKWLQNSYSSDIGFLIGHGEVLPSTENQVTLSKELDRWGIPIPHICMSWGQNEKNMAKHMTETILEIINASGGEAKPLQNLLNLTLIDPLIKNAAALQEEAPPPGYYIHEVGGARMGTSEENSVVDKFNRLWNCQNVLVVDGACWPSSGWQSPTLTMMAITRRACLEALKSRHD